MNRGAQLLAVQVKAHKGQAKLAGMLGIDQGNLCRYVNGDALPGYKTRVLFEDRCHVPIRSWDEDPLPELAANDVDAEPESGPRANGDDQDETGTDPGDR